VTGFTIIAGRNVKAWLARRTRPVMAADAGTGESAVINSHRLPAHGTVASVTIVAADDVIARLAKNCAAIVTGKTLAGSFRPVVHVDLQPALIIVTGVAALICWNMIERFCRCRYAAAEGMTGFALSRGPLENPADMTAVA